MGKRYNPHSDLCGCERCAVQAEKENPQQVFDEIDDPEYDDDPSGYWAAMEDEAEAFSDDY